MMHIYGIPKKNFIWFLVHKIISELMKVLTMTYYKSLIYNVKYIGTNKKNTEWWNW